MLFPYRTDAPTYHFPFATIGLIVANVAVHVWARGAGEEAADRLILHYGKLAPWEWITSVFAHSGWDHLIGNLLFLWVFGLVVEGKLGWLRFLAVYGAIAVASNALEQTVLLGGEGGSLGASGVIFGLMAICAVWAPENEVECLFLWIPVVRTIELRFVTFIGFFLAWQVFLAMLDGFAVGSAVLHLVGAAAGLGIGIVMLRRGWVNCEGWDWFSRRAHRARPTWAMDTRAAGVRKRLPARDAGAAAAAEPAAPPVATRFAVCVRTGDLTGALLLHAQCSPPTRATLDPGLRERLVLDLVRGSRTGEARPVLRGLLDDGSGNARMGLLEAELLLGESRTSRAGRVLDAVEGRLAGDSERRAHAALAAEVARRKASGEIELED